MKNYISFDKVCMIPSAYNNNVNSFIFRKKLNSHYKLVPFNVSANDIGITKYLPPVSKEWKNTVYNFNSNNLVNYPVYDLKINSLIKSYFNLYFNHKFLQHKYISRKKKRKSLNKIYVSKAEIKHTNSKAIITIYVYNRERFLLLDKISKLKKNIKKRVGRLVRIVKFERIFAKLMILSINKNNLKKFLSSPLIFWTKYLKKKKYSGILWRLANYKLDYSYYKVVDRTSFIIRMKRLARIFYRILGIIRRYRLRLSLNKYKFEEVFLYKLSKLISKYYGKKVEFNIVNLKSIAFNGDIFTEILRKKLKKERRNLTLTLNSLLSKVVLPNINRVIEKGRLENSLDLKLIDNKYKNVNVCSILHNNSFNYSLNELLYSIYYESIDKKESKLTTLIPNPYSIRDILLENIKYKNMGGARLRVKGRLTKRYRADRAVFNLKWKGGLKNIDSAFKGLSSVVYRGYLDSNVETTISSSKRRIGSFGIKAWVSGKNYSTMANRPTKSNIYTSLHPGFITGFSDAEGSFMVAIYKDNTRQIGWAIKLIFRISLHVRDLAILEHIRDYFGKGKITSDIDAQIRF
uniref:Ribosomal protein S3 n=1 Tax=Nemania diffusa TaxID=389665 RepID=A0A6M8P041_9PEZI|nr:ribosomal protein S3 [Nemania diffusa]QKG05014.1 ribosomal protein S3 [Nemania diffusa]